MPKIQYKEINFRSKSLDLIRLVNEVIGEYKAQGYELTLRQTYYQLVARGYIPNNERSYKNIGSRNDFTTFFRDKDGEITVKCGCFLGKIDRFLEKVTLTHGNSKYALVYRAAVEVAKLQIDLTGEAPEMDEE